MNGRSAILTLEREAPRPPPSGSSTLRGFWIRYLAYATTNKRASTVRTNKVCFGALIAFFGDAALDAITPYRIEEYKAHRRAAGVSAYGVNRDLELLKNMYNVAIRWGIYSSNPMKDVRLLREPPPRTRFLTRDEIDRLMFTAPAHLTPLIKIALYTGMRRGEILGLGWSDVAEDGASARLTRTKSGEARTVYFSRAAREVIAGQRAAANGPHVFHHDGLPYRGIGSAWRRALRRAGIENFRFHDLRHTFASHMVMRGADIRSVQALLGHKTIAMTMRYSHLSAAHLRDAVEKLAGFDASPVREVV